MKRLTFAIAAAIALLASPAIAQDAPTASGETLTAQNEQAKTAVAEAIQKSPLANLQTSLKRAEANVGRVEAEQREIAKRLAKTPAAQLPKPISYLNHAGATEDETAAPGSPYDAAAQQLDAMATKMHDYAFIQLAAAEPKPAPRSPRRQTRPVADPHRGHHHGRAGDKDCADCPDCPEQQANGQGMCNPRDHKGAKEAKADCVHCIDAAILA